MGIDAIVTALRVRVRLGSFPRSRPRPVEVVFESPRARVCCVPVSGHRNGKFVERTVGADLTFNQDSNKRLKIFIHFNPLSIPPL